MSQATHLFCITEEGIEGTKYQNGHIQDIGTKQAMWTTRVCWLNWFIGLGLHVRPNTLDQGIKLVGTIDHPLKKHLVLWVLHIWGIDPQMNLVLSHQQEVFPYRLAIRRLTHIWPANSKLDGFPNAWLLDVPLPKKKVGSSDQSKSSKYNL